MLQPQVSESAHIDTDTIPSFSGVNSALAQEAELYGVIDSLKAHGIRFVILRSTNTLDYLFLTRFLHRAYPEAFIVTMGPDILFGREIDTTEFRGLATLSAFPLLPRGQDWTSGKDATARHAHRVFSSDSMEGTYLATRFLIPGAKSGLPDYGPPFWEQGDREPVTWLSIIGRDGYWPVAVLKDGYSPNREKAQDLIFNLQPVAPSAPSNPLPPDEVFPITRLEDLLRAAVPCHLHASAGLSLPLEQSRPERVRSLHTPARGSSTFSDVHWLGGDLGRSNPHASLFRSIATCPGRQKSPVGLHSCLLRVLGIGRCRMGHGRAIGRRTRLGQPKLAAQGWLDHLSFASIRDCSRGEPRDFQRHADRLPRCPLNQRGLSHDFFAADAGRFLLVVLADIVGPGPAWSRKADSPSPGKVPAAFARISSEMAGYIEDFAMPFPRFCLKTGGFYVFPFVVIMLLVLALLHPFGGNFDSMLHSFENKSFNVTLHLMFAIAVYLVILECTQLLSTWLALKRLLLALNRTPLRRTFSALQGLSMHSLWSLSGTTSRARYTIFSHQLESLFHLRNVLSSSRQPGNQELRTRVEEACKRGQAFIVDRTTSADLAMINTTAARRIRKQISKCAECILTDFLLPDWCEETGTLDLVEDGRQAD